jgi:hypothetical protein
MPKIHEIVASINSTLKSEQFTSKRFQQGEFYAIAELLKNESEELVPCVVDNYGDTTIVSIDDTKPIQVYHRVLGIDFKRTQDFGDLKSVTEGYDMVMVVIGDRNRLQLNQEEIISGVVAGFPLDFTQANLTTWGLKSVEIEPGEINTDKERVFRNEFNTQAALKSNTIIFSFPYKVITEIDQSCFTLCN